MAPKGMTCRVVKTPEGKYDAGAEYALFGPAAARRSRLDANPAVDQADQRTGKGLFQPWH